MQMKKGKPTDEKGKYTKNHRGLPLCLKSYVFLPNLIAFLILCKLISVLNILYILNYWCSLSPFHGKKETLLRYIGTLMQKCFPIEPDLTTFSIY